MKDNLDRVEFYDLTDEHYASPLLRLLVWLALIGFCTGFWLAIGYGVYWMFWL
jgi:hypothetical protein